MNDLYQEMILEHNKNPKNFKELSGHTHHSEGDNPLCGDHLHIYLKLDENGCINEISFQGSGCAISKASASMMTQAVKGKKPEEVQQMFEEFRNLVTGKLDPAKDSNKLGKLNVFSGIWQYPSRVKCAILAWHTLKNAIDNKDKASTEDQY